MTVDQRRRIRDSFGAVSEISGPVILLFYGKLFELDPSVRKLFHNDLAAQSKKLIEMLGAVVESLDHFDAIAFRLADLGRKHAEFGVRPEHYDTLSAALLWALAQGLGADFDAQTREAWQAAIAAINTAMKKGAGY